MIGRAATRRAGLTLAAACLLRVSAPAAAAPVPDLATLLRGVGDRVASYYQRAQSVICTETATVQPIDHDWSMHGFARTVVSELHVEFDAAGALPLPEARVVREILRVNGRLPRERDATSRNSCMDPNPLSPEPLAFLLPPRRDAFQFTSVRAGREGDRAALVIAFTSADRTTQPELIEDPRGRDDCYDVKGAVPERGQVWIDAETYDVLRVDRALLGPSDVRVPDRLQRSQMFAPYITVDRDDESLHFRPVAFTDPDETLLLPETIESVALFRSGLQSTRRTQRYSGYRRFLTAGKVKVK